MNRALVSFAVTTAALAGSASAETIFGLTVSNRLVSFDSASPLSVASGVNISGLQASERLLGIDFRPANGQLYGLGSSGRLYSIDSVTGAASQVGSGTFALGLQGDNFGFDFNPQVDRIRVTSDARQNLRLNPITGAVVDADAGTPGVQPDGTLTYAAADMSFGINPRIVGSAYTNNFNGTTSTTLFNIDAETGNLVRQGSAPGASPVVSPNSGTLFTIGSLLLDPGSITGFDISSFSGIAYLSANIDGFPNSALYTVNLQTGAASFVSSIDSDALVDIATVIPVPTTTGVFAIALLSVARRRR